MFNLLHFRFPYTHYIITGVLLIILVCLTATSTPKWSDAELAGPYARETRYDQLDSSVRRTPIELPFLANGSSAFYSIKADLQISWLSPRVFTIIPDDRLLNVVVNGQFVDLSGISEEKLQDVTRGFNINLSQYLVSGENSVVFELKNYYGDVGISMTSSLLDWRVLISLSVLFLALAWTFILSLRRVGFSWSHCWLYLLIILGAVIHIWCIFTYNPVNHIWSDPQRHWEQGIDVLRIDLMSLTDPIGYQIYVGILAKLSLKIPALVAFYTSLLALAGAWLWYRFLRELQSSKTLALVGWAFFSLLPSWTAIYTYFMQETLMIPLLGAALWATWRCRRKADTTTFLIMVILWVMVGLTRGVTIPMAAVVCTWLWLSQDYRLKKAVYSIIVLALLMGPLVYRSYVTVHHFAPHGMGHLNQIYSQSGKREISIAVKKGGSSWGYGFASPSVGAKPFEPFSDWKSRRTGVVRIHVDLDKGREDWDHEAEKIKMTFGDYLWIVKENMILLFVASSWPDNNNARVIDAANSVMRFLWVPFFILIIVATIFYRKKLKGQWMLASILLAWFVVQGLLPISVNEGRYRKPFEGLAVAQLLLILAARKGLLRDAASATPLKEVIHECVVKFSSLNRNKVQSNESNRNE